MCNLYTIYFYSGWLCLKKIKYLHFTRYVWLEDMQSSFTKPLKCYKLVRTVPNHEVKDGGVKLPLISACSRTTSGGNVFFAAPLSVETLLHWGVTWTTLGRRITRLGMDTLSQNRSDFSFRHSDDWWNRNYLKCPMSSSINIIFFLFITWWLIFLGEKLHLKLHGISITL